jgi:hypothetical protein
MNKIEGDPYFGISHMMLLTAYLGKILYAADGLAGYKLYDDDGNVSIGYFVYTKKDPETGEIGELYPVLNEERVPLALGQVYVVKSGDSSEWPDATQKEWNFILEKATVEAVKEPISERFWSSLSFDREMGWQDLIADWWHIGPIRGTQSWMQWRRSDKIIALMRHWRIQSISIIVDEDRTDFVVYIDGDEYSMKALGNRVLKEALWKIFGMW